MAIRCSLTGCKLAPSLPSNFLGGKSLGFNNVRHSMVTAFYFVIFDAYSTTLLVTPLSLLLMLEVRLRTVIRGRLFLVLTACHSVSCLYVHLQLLPIFCAFKNRPRLLSRNYSCDSTTIRLRYDDTTTHSTTTEVIEITICVRFSAIRLRSDYDVSRASASIRRDSTRAKMNMSIFRRSRIVVESQTRCESLLFAFLLISKLAKVKASKRYSKFIAFECSCDWKGEFVDAFCSQIYVSLLRFFDSVNFAHNFMLIVFRLVLSVAA